MGIGWPRSLRSDGSPLGWPEEAGSEQPRVDDDVSRETDPLGTAVSRETDPLGTVSRETAASDADLDAEEVGVVDDAPTAESSAPPKRWPDGPWPLPPTPRIIGVANQKGGVGKTTSTVNLAVALAQHGARVLVVDLDPQGNTSTAFSVEHREGTPSIYDVLVHGRPLGEVAAPVDGVSSLRCAPATIDLAGAEIELVSMVARETRLAKALVAAGSDYDYIFIDCPPSLGLLTVNALVAAREVLIPIQCEFYALEGLSQLLRNIELVRAHLNPALHVSTILLTMFDARTRLAEQVAAEVRNHFGPVVLSESIPRSVRISEAPGYGQSVMTYDPSSRGARAYAQAAFELAARAVDGQTEAETKEGESS
jgi:chromosome partitioning protein